MYTRKVDFHHCHLFPYPLEIFCYLSQGGLGGLEFRREEFFRLGQRVHEHSVGLDINYPSSLLHLPASSGYRLRRCAGGLTPNQIPTSPVSRISASA